LSTWKSSKTHEFYYINVERSVKSSQKFVVDLSTFSSKFHVSWNFFELTIWSRTLLRIYEKKSNPKKVKK
jgi:hypothetical protein